MYLAAVTRQAKKRNVRTMMRQHACAVALLDSLTDVALVHV
jgi:hypothetical protein